MKTAALRRLMHLVLAAAAADACMLACGGAIEVEVDDDPSGTGTGTGSRESSSGSTSGGPITKRPERRPDGGADVNAPDAKPDTSVPTPDSGPWTCLTGMIDPDPELCCAKPGDPLCNGAGSGDLCTLDCAAVCQKVAPGIETTGFTSCYWSASATAPQIGYVCGFCGVGRIPGGVAACERGASVAERLAMQAYYEAVSVIAFERLAAVLEAEDAPETLVHRARTAARDEQRHAALFTRLATARGASVATPEVSARPPSLLDLARENAREGCVRETYGALVALHQAEHAKDAELRAAFAAIAEDEIAHAALSWDLARWFDERLGASSAPIAGAIRELRAAATSEHDAVGELLGVPRPPVARAMFDDLFERLAA